MEKLLSFNPTTAYAAQALWRMMNLRCNLASFRIPKTLPWYGFLRREMIRRTLVITWYILHPDHRAVNPVQCLLLNQNPDLFPLQDIKSVHLASKPLLNSCLPKI